MYFDFVKLILDADSLNHESQIFSPGVYQFLGVNQLLRVTPKRAQTHTICWGALRFATQISPLLN